MISLYENFVSDNLNIRLLDTKDKELKKSIKTFAKSEFRTLDNLIK